MAESRRSEQTHPPYIPGLAPERELPVSARHANPRLYEAAEAIGTALGKASRQVQNARNRFTVIQGGVQSTPAEHIKQIALDEIKTAQEKVEEIKERAGEVIDSAMRRARLARLRAARFRAERPLTLIGIIGGAAFLLGIFLRLGRDKRG